MTNKEKLFEDINPHTRYWDCYRDEPLEYNHTGKVIKICKDFTISFTLFCAENSFGYSNGKWRMKKLYPTFKTTEELLKIYLKQE